MLNQPPEKININRPHTEKFLVRSFGALAPYSYGSCGSKSRKSEMEAAIVE